MNFTKHSNQLVQLFQSRPSDTPHPVTRTSAHLLSVLCDDIREADRAVRSLGKWTPTVAHIHSARQIPKPRQFNATSFADEVRHHIHDHIVTKVCYRFSLQHRPYTIYFLLESPSTSFNETQYNRYAHLIAMWLYVADKYRQDAQCANSTTLYLYMTSLQKRLPKSNIDILNEVHVNTAFTYSCPKDAEIVVFRKEEWFKVFIHETFHAFGLDFSTMNNDDVHACILRIFDVPSKVNAYEAYIEFWAEIINALFCGFYATYKEPESFLSVAMYFIQLESQFSLFQLTKALQFMGLRYSDLYAKTKQATLLRKTRYKEHTSVLAYYIIKGVLMAHWSKFLDWCHVHNTPSCIAFKRTAENQTAFCRFIETHYKSKSMMTQLAQSTSLLSRLQTKNYVEPFVLNTMRMTLWELG
ncbi:MAG: hypothetical protein ACOVRN_16835 [Flavobacterium sp.]